MRWTPGRSSGDVVDRRGSRGGGGMRMGLGGGLVLLVLSLVFGRDFFSLVGAGGGGMEGPAGDAPVATTAQEDTLYAFVDWVVGDAQDTWSAIFQQGGQTYPRARVVVYRDLYQSACGRADASVGPFYCPADQQVYLDLSFFDELARRFGAPGDFAQAYVVAHEIGHHVQHVLGAADALREAQRRNPGAANQLSVAFELQADCLAGVWAHSTARRDLLETGDVEEGLGAAAAIGDDRLQRMGRGEVQPETFTHGSSAQRVAAFRRGMETGSPAACEQ